MLLDTDKETVKGIYVHDDLAVLNISDRPITFFCI